MGNKRENKPEKKKERKERHFLYDVVWGIGYALGCIGFRQKVLYITPKAKEKIQGGALLVANHVSFFDPVYMLMTVPYRRQHFIATKEFFSTKFKKYLFEKVFLCISIDRSNVGTATFRTIVNELKKGEVVSMFPEGHINTKTDGSLDEFKSGVVLMALKSNCPIIPMYVHRRKSIFHRLITVVGEPYEVSMQKANGSVIEYMQDAAKEIREKEIELEQYYNEYCENKHKESHKGDK